MSCYRRPHATGARIFFTVALATRGGDLLTREVDRLRAAVVQTRNERPFGIDAWVVLPDHMHAVWTLPPGDGDFATRWAAIKVRFSRGMDADARRPSHGARREKGIWQRRFWEHHLRDDAEYDAHVHHCWWNPVKHGLVDQAAAWPYSSIHRDIRHARIARDWHPPCGNVAAVGCASAHRLRRSVQGRAL